MFYTIYKITNKINGNFYIGKHQTKNLDDGYMGSGKLIKAAIKKHGIEKFTKEILHVFDNDHDMNEAEKELVILGEGCYNLCPGGSGGFGYINEKKLNRKCTKEQLYKQLEDAHKVLKILWSDEEWKINHCEKLSAAFLGRKSPFLGKKHSQETRQKMTEIKKSMQSQKGVKNSQYGRPKSEETKQKIRESLARFRANKSAL